jgi:probable HAF family extracellular repeat protein
MPNNIRPIVLLAMVLVPVLGCADRATAPAPTPGTAQLARDPQALVPVDLGTLGGLSAGRSSEAHAVNPSGDIAGWSTPTQTFGAFRVHAVLWRNGEIIDLGTLGGDLSRARGINPSGVVVGSALTPDNYYYHAFRWENGVMTNLGALPGYPGSDAFGISPDGRVVGRSQRSDGGGHACLWENGAMVDLGTLGGVTSVAYAINPSGVIVGSSQTTEGAEHAFVWRDGTMTDLGTLGGARSVAYAINPRGDVVGSSTTAAAEEHAVLWRKNGDIVDLGPPGRTSVARGINASGQIVGYFSDSPFGGAFLWQNGVMTELPPVVLELPGEPPARGDAHAYAINASGDIVGDGRTFLMPHGALWTRK